ncbi:plasmid recombination protein [Bacillus licheniformis]|jgi:Plasmid recombination enzyme|nr:plasmid recombination protein [Bacillus licheniformis]KAA0820281.1 plasmid recombination protein [Bacillus licheniformis]KAA0822848.1 plasmid recombination protein [Bacillus licheniformis]PSS47686.1 plasmid recombination protein [Bacillus licheniformis]TWL17969.1 Plasmid recombination enzyme [Bacillus licheniformis]
MAVQRGGRERKLSYIICNMRKFKNADLKGLQIHNQREKESHTNPDIDESRTKLNYDLLHQQMIDYKAIINEHISKNVETKRAIRKDAVRCCSFMISASPEFFEGLSPEREKAFFQSNLAFLQERYGKENVMYAAVHKDEKTPHMHVGVVPITKEKKLSAKQIFNKVEMKQLQEAIGRHNEKWGLLRGEPSDKKYLEMNEFKREALKQEIKELEIQKAEHEQASKQIEERLEDLKETAYKAGAVDRIEVKESGFLSSKSVKMSKEDYEQLKSLARSADVLRKENELLKDENRLERARSEELKKTKDRLNKEKAVLKQENQELKTENLFLKRAINKFIETFKDRKQEMALNLGYVKAYILQKMKMPLYRRFFGSELEEKGAANFLNDEKQNEAKRSKRRDHGMDMER